MEKAVAKDIPEIYDLYRSVIEAVNRTDIKLGWNIEMYPNLNFIEETVANGEMLIIRAQNRIVAVAVVNNKVNDEYNKIDWHIKEPCKKIFTVHALATAPDCRGTGLSKDFIEEIKSYCKNNGGVAIHLDVIDTNIPAYKLYTRNGFLEKAEIKMFYEVVGLRNFWMLECIL